MLAVARTIDVKDFIDESRFSLYQWLIISICFLAIAVDVFDLVAIGYATPLLINEWHVSKAELGSAMGAGVMGMAIGAILAGVFSDRWRPKRFLTLAMTMYAVCSIACAFTSGVGWLAALRFLTGVGIGAAVPGIIVLAHEYAPARKAAIIVNTVYCGGGVGGALCGVVAAALISRYGWQSIFIVGGVMPLILVLMAWFVLPEPLHYMVLKGRSAQQIAATLRRIAPATSFENVQFVLSDNAKAHGKPGISLILSRYYLFDTLMLWLTYFGSSFVYYLLMGWLPTVLRESGTTVSQASLVTSLFALGGAGGAIAMGWLMDRLKKDFVVAFGFALGAAAVWLIGQQNGNLGFLAASTCVAGACIAGGMGAMSSLAVSSYPRPAAPLGLHG